MLGKKAEEDLTMPLVASCSQARLPSLARNQEQLPFGRHHCSRVALSARARDRRRAGLTGRAQCSTTTNRQPGASKEVKKSPPPAQVRDSFKSWPGQPTACF